MSRIKKKQFELVSNDPNVTSLIENLKANQSLYKKIINTLLSLGIFNNSINCNVYEISNNEERCYIKLWCEDLDGNIYIFCPKSNIKHDLNILQKINNDSEKKYDVTLSKKFDITSSNVELMQTESVFNFKFGRLITDEKSFYNLFLGDNVCYQIQINDNQEKLNAKDLLTLLNQLEIIPTFKNYTDIFAQLICEKQINYSSMLLGAYKNFESLGRLKLQEEKNNTKVLK